MPTRAKKKSKPAGKKTPAKKKSASAAKKKSARAAKPLPRRRAGSPPDPRARARHVVGVLRPLYDAKGTALEFRDPFQLLISTILSAQCTDAMVNQVAPRLFARYPDAASLGRAKPEAIEKIIHSTGFFRQKTKSLIAASRDLTERHGGRVPKSIEELIELRGVGRKTAHCVRAFAFGLPGLIVDTHFKRVAGRLGLTDQTDPTKIERAIAELLDPADWTAMSNGLTWHGRAVCDARKPQCAACPLLADCPHGREQTGAA